MFTLQMLNRLRYQVSHQLIIAIARDINNLGINVHLCYCLPCLKSNIPGPSVVPAAKLYPMAGLHVLA